MCKCENQGLNLQFPHQSWAGMSLRLAWNPSAQTGDTWYLGKLANKISQTGRVRLNQGPCFITQSGKLWMKNIHVYIQAHTTNSCRHTQNTKQRQKTTHTHTESHFYYKEKDPISIFISLVGFQDQQGLPRAILFTKGCEEFCLWLMKSRARALKSL